MTSHTPVLPATPVLDTIGAPSDLKALSTRQLRELADELRAETISAVSVTGGHLGAGLGVVELTIAIHAVFDTPKDKLIWDVGHQCYPHKILTDRRDRIRTLRAGGGLSGFTRRSESPYDPFGAAHAGTSVSSGLGFAVSRDLCHRDNHVICVVGDGAMSAGMIYEALNNAGARNKPLIVILNDNDMSIAPPVGAISNYLSRTVSSRGYRRVRTLARKVTRAVGLFGTARKAERYARDFALGGGLFDALGMYYVGPVDGHNIDILMGVLANARDMRDGPVLIHAVTQKGKGYAPAEASHDKYHGVSRFNIVTGKQSKNSAASPGYTSVFATELVRIARSDPKVVAITAAMPGGTGLDVFARHFPERTFDVGIAEQHAVTFAAGLAADGMRPFAAVYSTFLQRAYDSVVHDVAIQKLPVRFAIDRAGLVGADGPTHAGAFDTGFLGSLPGFVLMAAADQTELQRMIATAHAIDDGPSAVRYPRGSGRCAALLDAPEPLEIGRGRIVRHGTDLAFLSYGARLTACLDAADLLAARGISATVADARFAKPLDTALIAALIASHRAILTVEEGACGGFGAMVLHHLAHSGALDTGVRIRTLTLPDRFQDQDTPENMYADAGLDANGLASTALALSGSGLQTFSGMAEVCSGGLTS